MKISAFHLMPHRELPADFEKRYPSVWVTPPWWELADPARVGQYYNWTLDELLFAARASGAGPARVVSRRDSGDETGDDSSVVGYAGVIVQEKEER